MAVSSSPIDLEVTQLAKERIDAKMLDCGLDSPIPGLMWSKWSDQVDYCWQIGFYERSQIFEGVILEASETELYVFQEWLLEDLKGAVLDIENDRIVVKTGSQYLKPEHPLG